MELHCYLGVLVVQLRRMMMTIALEIVMDVALLLHTQEQPISTCFPNQSRWPNMK